MNSPAESMLIEERLKNTRLEEYISDLEQLIIGLHDDDDIGKRRIDLRKLKYTIYAHKYGLK